MNVHVDQTKNADRKAGSHRICDYSDTNYAEFWENHDRGYEDAVERIALRRLAAGFSGTCIEIGGGYGRLVQEYAPLCTKVLLTDYAENMLQQARTNIDRLGLDNVTCKQADLYQLSKFKMRFQHAVCIRVLHHVEDVPAFFIQVNQILEKDGTFILEYANKKNLLRILRYFFRRSDITPFGYWPINRKGELYYNYHPQYIKDMLIRYGFLIEEELSVSMFRNKRIKKIMGKRLLTWLEARLQKPLGRFHLSPSVFLRVRKVREIDLQ